MTHNAVEEWSAVLAMTQPRGFSAPLDRFRPNRNHSLFISKVILMSPMLILKVFRTVFTVVGLGLLAGALWSYLSTSSFVVEAARAEGVVIDLEQSRSSNSSIYRPVVRFTAADGVERTFVTSWGSRPASHSRGDVVQVLYPAERPEEADIESFLSLWGRTVITGCLGVAFFVAGAGMIAFDLFFQNRKRSLRANGRIVQADFKGVERNGLVKLNGRHPWRIICQWQDAGTGKVHVFASDNFWYDPTEYVTSKQFDVRIDPENPRRYWLDTSSLPVMAE